MAKILVVDDDPALVTTLQGYLSLRGHQVHCARDLVSAREILRREAPCIVVLDVFLGRTSGLDFLSTGVKVGTECGVIMISAHADIATAVRAIRLGAFDFLEKPIDTDRLDILIANLWRDLGFHRGITRLRETWREENLFLGSSPLARETMEIVERAATSTLSVLITGENGTGKEVYARYLHMSSDRVGGPFVPVNCSALPAELIESELFGHRKGAFTGAHADKEGYFRAAHGGTLFLDEIGELPVHLQPKLLRVLENREIQQIGSTATQTVDVRIVSATNQSLTEAVAAGRFREDLYYRLSQLPVRIPALRDRREDIRGLAAFLGRGRNVTLSEDAVRYLETRQWPGNIRELRNLIERVAVLARTNPVSGQEIAAIDAYGSAPPAADPLAAPMPLAEAKRLLEKRYIEARLAANGWSVKDTAAELGLLPNNLSRKLAELEIRLP